MGEARSDEAWQQLREKAEAATRGPWSCKYDTYVYAPHGVSDATAVVAEIDAVVDFRQGRADAEFIAAANPAVVLSLLSELAAARADNDHSFTEWAVQYEHGVHQVDDEELALDWQQYLPQPNWVVCRTVTRSAWRPASSPPSPEGTENQG